jgi:hypothetical protein
VFTRGPRFPWAFGVKGLLWAPLADVPPQPVCSAHVDRSAVDQIDRTKKIHLADIDAVVPEDGVGHRNVEKGVGDRHLQQIVLAADDLAGRPGELDLALARARVLHLVNALRESDRLLDACA